MWRQQAAQAGVAGALEIWRLTGAAFLVISHGAIKGRTASISAADCFAPVVLLYASPSWLRRIFGIPTDRELHRTSYLAGSPNGSVYRFSRKPCPPYHRGLIPGSRRHRAPGQLSVLTRPFPGGYPLPISGLFTLETETRLSRNWSITLKKKIPRGLSFILPPLANEKKIHERSFWNKKARNFTLPIEDVSLTCNSRKIPTEGSRRQNRHPCFCSSRLLTVRHIVPFCQGGQRMKLTALLSYPRARGNFSPSFCLPLLRGTEPARGHGGIFFLLCSHAILLRPHAILLRSLAILFVFPRNTFCVPRQYFLHSHAIVFALSCNTLWDYCKNGTNTTPVFEIY
ncbi:hypothetical protein ATANTOWER_002246 [Ataeniobius toweri]|uniref:Uncharacterized protein n=1 Tax=Ataeniobius toweri TaxID=208326 RepID=A0ABU7AD52_9TELE|nr:hypothetical protein [Ataeniobius toweri]